MGDKRRQRAVLDDPYLPLPDLATYSGLSVPTLREWLTHPEHPLPHMRVGKIIVVKRSEYDAWVDWFRVKTPSGDVQALADDVLRQLRTQ